MKTKIITLILVASFAIANSQIIVNLTPTESIRDSVMFYGGSNSYDNVTFILQPGEYNEPNGIVFPSVSGGEYKYETPRFVLQSSDGNPNSVIIESNNYYNIYIERGFVTIKDITLKSSNSTNQQSTILIEASMDDIDSLIVQNCIIQADTGQFDNAIEIMEGYGNMNNFHINNCEINNGSIGIYSSGGGYSDRTNNLNIINNTFSNQKERAISLSEMANLKILDNIIELPDTGDQLNSLAIGIELFDIAADLLISDGLTTISGNKIYKETNQQIAYSAISINTSLVLNSGNFIISNNFIDISTDTLITGISLELCENINFSHNSLRINGNNSSKCVYSIVENSSILIKNNIFESNGYAYYGDETQVTQMNYNNFYGSDTMFKVFAFSAALTQNEWSTNYGFDINSTSINPNFSTNLAELNLNNYLLNNTAPSLPNVTTDIDGLNRNTPMCDMGAKEIAFINLGNDTSICHNSTITLDGGSYYSYIWNTGSTSQSITTDSAGQYIVTVEEVEGGALATDTINITILPELFISFNTVEPNCYTSVDGYAIASILNGTEPINYNWAGSYMGDGSDSLYNIGLGTYYLTVTDVNLCSAESQVFINAPMQLSLNFDTVEFCGGCIGELTANALGGTGSYYYNWSTDETTQHIMDLCTGTYIVTLTDDNNCEFIESISITEGSLAYISGTVDYSGGNFNENEVKVELFKQYIENAFQIEQVDENIINASSNFEFTGVYPYSYTFRAFIEQGTYNNIASSYYGNTVDWYNATYVTVGCGDTINDIVFSMYEIPNLNGYGTFSGEITYEGEDKSINGQPVTGAEVYIEQEPNDEPIARGTTIDDGTWEIDSIPEGIGYKLRVDIPGLDQISTYYNLFITTNDTIQTNLNFIVDTAAGGGIEKDTTLSTLILANQTIEIKIYPNPVVDFITFETEITNASNIKLDIIDVKGNTVFTSKEIKNFFGEYQQSFNMEQYNTGTYLLRFKINDNYYLKKIIKK